MNVSKLLYKNLKSIGVKLTEIWRCKSPFLRFNLEIFETFKVGGGGLTSEKNHFFYEFFSKLSFKYKYLNVSHVTKHHLNNIR